MAVSEEDPDFTDPTFEDILGPTAKRFFGSGYRRVAHTFLQADAHLQSNENLAGTGHAEYPKDWSLDSRGKPRDAHLSSFDAIALTAEALRAGSATTLNANPLFEHAVQSITVKAPAVTSAATRNIPVHLTVDARSPGQAPTVRSRVGRFTTSIFAGRTRDSPDSASFDQQLHTPGQVARIGDGHLVRRATNGVTTIQQVHGNGPLTCIEELAMLGQLSQVAVYTMKNEDRETIPNLWLRHLTLERSPRHPTGTVTTRVHVLRDRIVRIGEDSITDLRLRAVTDYGATAEASYGFRAAT